jgi:hypothetical protein
MGTIMCAATNSDRNAPATDRQKAALGNFGAKVPKGINFGEASDWLRLLCSRLDHKEEITEQDLAEPPVEENFRPAAQLPPSPQPSVSPAVPTDPPVPSGNGGVIRLPTPDAWVTVELEAENSTLLGHRRRLVAKIAEHPGLGETFDECLVRLGKHVEKKIAAEQEVAHGASPA